MVQEIQIPPLHPLGIDHSTTQLQIASTIHTLQHPASLPRPRPCISPTSFSVSSAHSPSSKPPQWSSTLTPRNPSSAPPKSKPSAPTAKPTSTTEEAARATASDTLKLVLAAAEAATASTINSEASISNTEALDRNPRRAAILRMIVRGKSRRAQGLRGGIGMGVRIFRRIWGAVISIITVD